MTVLVGLAGIAVAWAIYSRHRVAVAGVPALRRLLEHKFYFDEAYDAVFYRPASALAARLRSDFEEPVVLATGTEFGETALDTGRAVRRLQTGLLRTYVFFLAGGAAVIAAIFLAVH